jgi:hypothetical protein
MMRRASAALLLLVSLIAGGSVAIAPAASAAVDGCGLVGEYVPPAEDDCRFVMAVIDETKDVVADDVFWVFCTVFHEHPACQ